MKSLKTLTGLQFFEDYLVPSNGETRNVLFEITGLPYVARRTPWFSLKAGVEKYGIIDGLRRRILSALTKGSVHTIAGVQCAVILQQTMELGGDGSLVAHAIVGAVVNSYCVALQANIGMRCFNVLEHRRKES